MLTRLVIEDIEQERERWKCNGETSTAAAAVTENKSVGIITFKSKQERKLEGK